MAASTLTPYLPYPDYALVYVERSNDNMATQHVSRLCLVCLEKQEEDCMLT